MEDNLNLKKFICKGFLLNNIFKLKYTKLQKQYWIRRILIIFLTTFKFLDCDVLYESDFIALTLASTKVSISKNLNKNNLKFEILLSNVNEAVYDKLEAAINNKMDYIVKTKENKFKWAKVNLGKKADDTKWKLLYIIFNSSKPVFEFIKIRRTKECCVILIYNFKLPDKDLFSEKNINDHLQMSSIRKIKFNICLF